jgi:PAS domain S-box-containing protein
VSSICDRERLAALHGLNVLDTPPEAIFDSMTRLAALTFQTPIALVSLVDTDRQWFKSCVGLDVRETSRDVAFCDHAIRQAGVMVVLDATQDSRFAGNPLVTGELGIRFYAGAPLVAPSGHRLGTLCIIDLQPRASFGEVQVAQLAAMANAVTDALIMRRDISKLVSLERERANNRALLTQAEEMAGVGHWSWDAKTDLTFWSPAVYRIHGYDPALPPPDLAGVLAMYHPDDARTLAGLVQRAVSHGESYSLSARAIRPDGQTRHVAARGTCDRDETGAVRSLIGTFIDVTDLKLADEQLRANEARLRFLLDQSPDLSIRVEPGRGITWVSPSCRLYGYEPEELVGTFALELVHPDDLANVEAVRAARFAGLPDPPGSTREHRIRHKDGSWICVQGNPTLIRGSEGQVIEIVNVLRDVSAARETARALEEARDAARAAAQVKTDFLANMSHELRTPLTSIIGFTGLATEQPDLTELTRDYIDRVGNASRALLCTVNDILDFSKLEAGQVTIHPEPVALAKLTRATLDLFTPQAGAKDLSLTLDGNADDDSLVIAIDSDRIRQILLNLVSNAVKFTAEGGVSLRTRYDPSANRLRVEVIDTGGGIAQDKQDCLFKRFSQIDGSLTRTQAGTGLGLAICKGLVEAMGGEIGVESQIGQGSCFWFEIPAAPAQLIEATSKSQVSDQISFAGVRVLVVDDNAANRKLASLFLVGLGVEVTTAEDGLAAVEMAAELPYDTILMDVHMPRLDGPGAFARIRGGAGPNDSTPILAFTADGDSDTRARLLRMGFDDVVEKPVKSALLIAAVARATAFAQQRQEALHAA